MKDLVETTGLQFCSGRGKTAETLDGIDWSEFTRLLDNPQEVEKDDARWAIFSTCQTRDHATQKQDGRFHALAVDIDDGNPSLATVAAATQAALGPDALFYVYSTKSATPEDRRWRVVVRLEVEVPGSHHAHCQQALFDAYEHQGLHVDPCLKKTGQILYLPNRGAHYEAAQYGTAPLTGDSEAFLYLRKRAIEYQAEEADIQRQTQGRQRAEGPRSHIAAFRRHHSIAQMLALSGYEQRGTSDNWRSPYQTSGSYATQDRGDHWISLSGSDAEKGIGRTTDKGHRFGDAFDLYLHYNCKGDRRMAEDYARQCLAEEDAASVAHGKALMENATCGGVSLLTGIAANPSGLEFAPIGEDEWGAARISPACIVKDYLYADVGALIAPGGVGKTTVVLYEAIHIALGLPLYGREVVKPGPVAILTAEDDRDLLIARLGRLAAALALTPDQLATVRSRVLIQYVGSQDFRLCRIDKDVVTLAPEVERLVDALEAVRPVMLVIDPTVSFGVGEQRVNDAEQGLIRAARSLRDKLGCCVRLVHHTGKGNAREETRDQYSGRGGSAMADGARMVHILQPLHSPNWEQEVGTPLTSGSTGLVLALPKMSYCPLQPPIYLERDGFSFKQVERGDEQDRESARNAVTQAKADRVFLKLLDEFTAQGRWVKSTHAKGYAPREFAASVGCEGLKKQDFQAAMDRLFESGQIINEKGGSNAPSKQIERIRRAV